MPEAPEASYYACTPSDSGSDLEMYDPFDRKYAEEEVIPKENKGSGIRMSH